MSGKGFGKKAKTPGDRYHLIGASTVEAAEAMVKVLKNILKGECARDFDSLISEGYLPVVQVMKADSLDSEVDLVIILANPKLKPATKTLSIQFNPKTNMLKLIEVGAEAIAKGHTWLLALIV